MASERAPHAAGNGLGTAARPEEAENMDRSETSFDNRFTRAFGLPAERIQTKTRPYLTGPIKAFIAESPMLVMATSDREGRCDASPKGGQPGFVRILDDRHLLVPDVAGNKLFQSYLNMDENPHVGLLFFIPGLSEVVRVNGRITIVSKDELDRRGVDGARYDPDETRDVVQGILVEVEEAYTHCPRALNYSRLWDPDEIARRQASGAHPLRAGAPA
jgi:uncharacterized protein